MDIIKQNKIGKWIIILLVVLNVLMLSSIWLKDNEQRRVPPPGRKDVVRFLQHELNLSADQVKKLAELRDEHFTATQEKLKRIMRLKKVLMESAFELGDRKSSPDSLAEEIGRLQSEIEVITFNHFQRLTEVCGKEKLPKLRELMGEIVGPPEPERPRLGTPPPPPKAN